MLVISFPIVQESPRFFLSYRPPDSQASVLQIQSWALTSLSTPSSESTQCGLGRHGASWPRRAEEGAAFLDGRFQALESLRPDAFRKAPAL